MKKQSKRNEQRTGGLEQLRRRCRRGRLSFVRRDRARD
jgi:hypothetical protein